MKPVYKILMAALLVAVLLSPLASSSPDGLERVATDLGFIEKGEGGSVIKSPLSDYTIPGVGNEAVSTALAGLTGTLLTFAAMYALARVLKKKKPGTNG
ncbi:MAG: PDGLE domain-containing protein [Bacillota bacterium]